MSDTDSDADWDEDTLPEPADAAATGEARSPAREVYVLDFKDGRSRADVTHGPNDPSRVWISLQNAEAWVHVSMEDGTARRLCEQLGEVLARFHKVRSAFHNRQGAP